MIIAKSQFSACISQWYSVCKNIVRSLNIEGLLDFSVWGDQRMYANQLGKKEVENKLLETTIQIHLI